MKIILHVILVSLLSFQAFAAEKNKISRDDIDRYMELAGVYEMVDTMPMQIEAMANQNLLTAKNPEAEKEIMQLLIYAWDSDSIKKSMVDFVQLHSNKKEIAELLDWRETPLATKITAAELESTSPNFQNEFLQYIASLQVTPPSPETMQAVRRLVESTDMVDMMIDITIKVTESMMASFMKADPENAGVTEADLKKQMDSMRAVLRPAIEQQAILTSYYLYRNISDEELADYSSFYESDLGQRELKLVSESLMVGMSKWAEQSAIAIVKYLEENTPQ